jgi:hypothetical protein
LHATQLPPQSTPVSLPLCTPSLQWAGTQLPRPSHSVPEALLHAVFSRVNVESQRSFLHVRVAHSVEGPQASATVASVQAVPSLPPAPPPVVDEVLDDAEVDAVAGGASPLHAALARKATGTAKARRRSAEAADRDMTCSRRRWSWARRRASSRAKFPSQD